MEKKKFDHYKFIWLYSMLITTVVIVLFMITSKCTPFGGYSLLNYDAFHQFMAFCSELRRKVLSGESLFYSWNIGMGINFLAVFAVILNSPFNILLLFFSNEDICIPVTLIIILKIIFSSGAMGYYLTKHFERMDEEKSKNISNGLIIIGFSIAYATSGYVCGYYWNFMWLDVIMILPLIMLGMDRLIHEGKPVLYIFALFYSINCNYYLSIMVCIFLVLYFFTYKYESVKDFFVKGLKFAGASIVAAGMASLIILVAYKNIKYSNTSQDLAPEFGWFGNICFLLKSHYFLSVPIISQPYDGDANLYCGVITVITFLFYPFVKKISIRERISKILIAVFLLISMNNTVLNYIWHGLHDQKGVPNRFSFLYIFLLLVIAFDVIIRIEKENIKKFIAPGIIAAMFPIVIYFFNDYDGYISSKSMLLVALAMSFVYVIVLFVRMYNEKTYKVTNFVLFGLVALEASAAAYISLKYNELNDTEYFMAYINGRKPAIDYIKEVDGEPFYRQEIADNVIDNESIFHGMKGLSLFSSVISSDMEMAMRNIGVKNMDISIYYTSYNPFLDDIFGIKYIHCFWDDDQLAEFNEKVYDDNNVVYKNSNALPVGFGVSRDLEKVDISKNGNATFNQNQFAKCSVGADDIYISKNNVAGVYSPEFELEWDEEASSINVIRASIEEVPELVSLCISYNIDEAGEYCFNCDYHYIYAVNIYVDQNLISENENANQTLRIGELEEGQTVMAEIQVPTVYLERNIPVYLSLFDKSKEEEAVDMLSKHVMNVDRCSANTLSGEISLDDNQMLFLSIPYDKGWTAYVDGKKTDIIKVYGAFSGIEMDAGTHKVELKYVSEGFTLGLITTVISWGAFILIGIICFKKKRKAVEA